MVEERTNSFLQFDKIIDKNRKRMFRNEQEKAKTRYFVDAQIQINDKDATPLLLVCFIYILNRNAILEKYV